MQSVSPPEGFAFSLDENNEGILLRIEDHREDPLFQEAVVDECRALRRSIRALGLDLATAEVCGSSGEATTIQGEAGPYIVRHVTLRWSRHAQPRRAS